jgi:chromate transporter
VAARARLARDGGHAEAAGMTGTAPPTSLQIFLAYARIGLLSFGGAAAMGRRVIVEERRWLSERDYAEVMGLCQVLPGPNVGNGAVMIGRRFRGLPGALAGMAGMYLAPLCILSALLLGYGAFGDRPGVAPVMQGIAAAAAGMIAGTGLRMLTRLRPPPEALAVIAATIAAAAWWQVPLPWILLVLGPLGILAAAWRMRRG